MSATRRGYAAFGICLAALAAGSAFGARALNAVVVPGLVALAAGWIASRRIPYPTVTRSQPASGFPGEERTIVLDTDAERATTATVRDRADEGLSAPETGIETGIPGRIEYDCRLDERGEHVLGPATVTIEDALGLFSREFRSARTTDVLVYPPVRPLSDRAGRDLLAGEEAPIDDRGEFDSLREYVPGDPLRDVHWKASAKREAFVVTEFAASEEEGSLAIVAEAAPGEAEEMAIAAASVACWLLDAGVEIDLATPDGRLSGASAGRRGKVLALLARSGAGRVATARRERADIHIAAEPGGLTVSVGDSTIPFDRLLARGSESSRSPAGTRTPDARPAADGRGRAATDGGWGERP
jgi:uncharacterized protein (DUF58 family)